MPVREGLSRRLAFTTTAFVLALLATAGGCGSAPVDTVERFPPEGTAYIRGEVVEVNRLKAHSRESDIGTVLVEGARSSPVDEALLVVTRESLIVDRREGEKAAGFDAIEERQTIEANFTVGDLSSPNGGAEVEVLVICP